MRYFVVKPFTAGATIEERSILAEGLGFWLLVKCSTVSTSAVSSCD